MEIQVITYGNLAQRLDIVKAFLADMAERGQTVQLVHQSRATASALEAALDVSVLSAHDLAFSFVSANCIAVLDGDIIDARVVDRLTFLRKPLYLLVPNDAIPAIPDQGVLQDLLNARALVPSLAGDEEQPKTFGCHHAGETCSGCDGMVAQWKAVRRDCAAPIVA